MSGGAWNQGPPSWVKTSPKSQSALSEDTTTVQSNAESSSEHADHRNSAGFDGKSRVNAIGDAVRLAQSDRRVTVRRDTSPWYPGKVNRNRKRGHLEPKGSREPVPQEQTDMTSPGSASSSTFTNNSNGSNITVVNVHKKDLNNLGYKDLVEWVKQPNHLYIGRDMTRFVPGAVHSKWHNPNKSRKVGREQSIKMYREYILTDKTIQSNGKTLLQSLDELKGKTLGCWCHPEKCHGHVLRELVKEYCD